MIVPHRYAPEHRWKEPESGTFNVEWLTFRRDARRARGAAVVARPVHRVVLLPRRGREDGRPEVPRRLARRDSRGVHVLEHPAAGSPRGTSRTTSSRRRRTLVDGRPLVFFHYHSLRLYRPASAARLATAAR